MIKSVCEKDLCVGCNACRLACSQKAIEIVDTKLSLNAYIDENKCVNCGVCVKVCQQNNSIEYTKPFLWYQGWANKEEVRLKASSGGLATTAVYYFWKKKYAVYSCAFKDGELAYKKVLDIEEYDRFFVGSKYIKSNTKEIYFEIKKELAKGTPVLFIGLPCHIQGLKMFIGEKLGNNLYTIDLICHGTPSMELYKQYLKEKGIDVQSLSFIKFRHKMQYDYKISPTDFEYWLYPFLRGLNYTKNCYSCKFARTERVSDITLGDSWGSQLDTSELNKGISLILVNSEKGQQLLEMLDIHVESVDVENAIANNSQLQHSSKVPENREIFERKFTKSSNYHSAIDKSYRKLIKRIRWRRSLFGKCIRLLRTKKTVDVNKIKIGFFEELQ